MATGFTQAFGSGCPGDGHYGRAKAAGSCCVSSLEGLLSGPEILRNKVHTGWVWQILLRTNLRKILIQKNPPQIHSADFGAQHFGRPLTKKVMSHSRDGPGVMAPSRTDIVPLAGVWNPPLRPPFRYPPPLKVPEHYRLRNACTSSRDHEIIFHSSELTVIATCRETSSSLLEHVATIFDRPLPARPFEFAIKMDRCGVQLGPSCWADGAPEHGPLFWAMGQQRGNLTGLVGIFRESWTPDIRIDMYSLVKGILYGIKS